MLLKDAFRYINDSTGVKGSSTSAGVHGCAGGTRIGLLVYLKSHRVVMLGARRNSASGTDLPEVFVSRLVGADGGCVSVAANLNFLI